MKPSDVAVLILAAGAGSRFARAVSVETAPAESPPSKLLAILDGRPILEHVLERSAALDAADTLVVLGAGTGAESLEQRITWSDERRVCNPHPERGLAGSVRIGLDSLAATADASVRAALILLGDQPRVSVEVMRRLLAAASASPGRPFVAPRYSAVTGFNPLLIRRDAWSRAAELEGDRGFGPLLVARPDLVHFVDVSGANPDVDTPGDLVSLSRA